MLTKTHTPARLMIPENVCGLACVRVSISAEIKADAVFSNTFGIIAANK